MINKNKTVQTFVADFVQDSVTQRAWHETLQARNGDRDNAVAVRPVTMALRKQWSRDLIEPLEGNGVGSVPRVSVEMCHALSAIGVDLPASTDVQAALLAIGCEI